MPGIMFISHQIQFTFIFSTKYNFKQTDRKRKNERERNEEGEAKKTE